jgi:hypothetical protein
MTPERLGYLTGMFLAIIFIPVVILIVCNFIPAAKRNPKIVYSVCGVLTVLLAFVASPNGVIAFIMAALGALFFFWGYTRAAKKLRDSAIVGSATHG